jgi:hypothetical protein
MERWGNQRTSLQCFFIAIMRAGAQAVIKGFEGSPHAALTAANRYQGLQGRRGPPVVGRAGGLAGAMQGGPQTAAGCVCVGVRVGARARR